MPCELLLVVAQSVVHHPCEKELARFISGIGRVFSET